MQMQTQQIGRKSKVTVPFYSTPSRLQGQTSAEIIKEARAAVMSSTAIGIKPVFTSRPFTPKEKERTLFGNIKKRNSRPPSSFSLKNLQTQELGPRLKLPSIDVTSKRKHYSTLHYSNNLSLDNLTEDYNAEALEEIRENCFENLPTNRKSHSCPKEGRIVKAVSYDELNIQFSTQKNFNKSTRNEESSSPYEHVDSIKGVDDGSEKNKNVKEYIRKEENLVVKINLNEKEDLKPNHTKNLSKEEQINEITLKSDLKEQKDHIESVCHNTQEFSQKNDDIISVQHINKKEIEKLTESAQQNELFFNSKHQIEDKNSAEKSVATEPKSQYLSNFQKFNEIEFQKAQKISMPLEIKELYKTAEYYENFEKDSLAFHPTEISNEKSLNNKVEYCTQKSNKDEKKDEMIEIPEKEIRKKFQIEKSNTPNIKSFNDEQFSMNNKKRYHIITKEGESKEKAYKKWISKQKMNVSELEQTNSEESWDLFWKNSYFRNTDTNTEHQVEKEKQFDVNVLRSLVNKIAGLVKIGSENNTIYDCTCELYKMIKKNYIFLDNRMKENIVRVLYQLADNEDPKIVVSLARIFFYLKLEHSLSVACKMVFKVARFDANDHLFLNEEDILELFFDGLGRASPLDCAESCIYGYGALKFLTMNHNILSRVLQLGALDLMTLHLKMINTAYQENGKVAEQTQHALFQLTGALRHVAAGEGALPVFITTTCIPTVCKALQLFQSDEDIVTNISRTLSLLSADDNVAQVLMSVENILVSIIGLMKTYKLNEKILIRLSYCLGNIVEHSDLARIKISRNEESLNILLHILGFYVNKDLELLLAEKNNSQTIEMSSYTVDDIIVKVIRIIANMSMNPIVGSNLSPSTNDKRSVELSKLLALLLMRKDPGITLLATLGCLNNISYYCNAHSLLIDITQGIGRVLELQSVDCQAEAARVLGNLTRHKEIRELIYTTGGLSKLIKLLTSKDQEVVKCVCGALVNLMLDPQTRQQFIIEHGIDKLVGVLEAFYGDWTLTSLAVRAIWNSCADDLSSAMLHNSVERLLNVLAHSLEEENWNDGNADWEEFASISTDLLEKINYFLEST